MTDITFHTGVSDVLGHTVRLLRKAWRSGSRVVVVADEPLLKRLDGLLWTAEPLEFLPHVAAAGLAPDDARLARSAVVLLRPGEAVPAAVGREVLVNCDASLAGDATGFARIIEIVGDTPEERQAGRQRWRAHEAAGHTVTHHAFGAPS